MKTESIESTVSREFCIVNQRGLHARASAKFVETVNAYDAEVRVRKDGLEVDGGSILDLMMLAASPGCSISVEATGPDAEKVISALETLVGARFGEKG